MKVNKRVLSIGLTISLIMAGAPNINALSSIEKIQGKDRYETSALIADKQIYDTVILVNTDNSIVDGLSASGLSGVVKAPIMLVQRDKIPTDVEKRLKDVKNAYVIGTEDTIGKSVENQLKNKGIEVKRIGGEDRIKTSYLIAKEISAIKPVNDGDKVFLVNGYTGEADAMSVSSVAARDGVPVILTDGKSIPFKVDGVQCYSIGSEEIMSNDLVSKTNSIRIAGKDRFETNKKVIQKFYRGANRFYISQGYKLVDAVAGSPLAKSKPIVLVNDGSDNNILRGANEVTSLGGMDKNVIEQCINSASKDRLPTIIANDVEIIVGDKFDKSMLNIIATDYYGNDLKINIEGKVDTNKEGTYVLKISAIDNFGQKCEVSVNVKVIVDTNTKDPNSYEFKAMVSNEIYNLINTYRNEKEKKSLKVLDSLSGLANAWSKYMNDKKIFAHEINGKNAAEIFSGFGMRSDENIAYLPMNNKSVYTSKDAKEIAKSIFELWKKSSKYNENMLKEEFYSFGFGMYVSSQGEVNATMEFLNS
ncbi:TPA: cell wall-binding repeat-containing protein [Clostridioides difficile]|nr:cell wall-binding protein [Clostridioides difficile]EGT5137568.1 cell wall-binding protein [Clostridioides difficile]EGT5282978.1 cell wall-binding protein [Clostridioides difficile]MBG0213346.1 cell wall-binding repeat-containing protein [Clostridioides difficile]MBY1736378.1 cell wall-binding repeat-containing protein [Clostridioides difficile]